MKRGRFSDHELSVIKEAIGVQSPEEVAGMLDRDPMAVEKKMADLQLKSVEEDNQESRVLMSDTPEKYTATSDKGLSEFAQDVFALEMAGFEILKTQIAEEEAPRSVFTVRRK